MMSMVKSGEIKEHNLRRVSRSEGGRAVTLIPGVMGTLGEFQHALLVLDSTRVG